MQDFGGKRKTYFSLLNLESYKDGLKNELSVIEMLYPKYRFNPSKHFPSLQSHIQTYP
jgi:hypothetical protein